MVRGARQPGVNKQLRDGVDRDPDDAGGRSEIGDHAAGEERKNPCGE